MLRLELTSQQFESLKASWELDRQTWERELSEMAGHPIRLPFYFTEVKGFNPKGGLFILTAIIDYNRAGWLRIAYRFNLDNTVANLIYRKISQQKCSTWINEA